LVLHIEPAAALKEEVLKKRRKKQRKPPYMIIGIGAVLVLGAVVLSLFLTDGAQAPGTSQPFSRTSEIERVTLTEAAQAFESGTAVFLDVRTPGEYAFSRIPGAVSIPINELSNRMGELNPDDWIITYCT
jgi:hypothetical protein